MNKQDKKIFKALDGELVKCDECGETQFKQILVRYIIIKKNNGDYYDDELIDEDEKDLRCAKCNKPKLIR